MRKPNSKLLVIDADVASSASLTMKKDPVSMCCQNFLEKVKKVCHRAIVTKDIQDEYNEHQSRYFRKWCKEMYAKKKLKCPPEDRLRYARELDLKSKIGRVVANHKERDSISKDIHLIEAALSLDKIVISRDDKMAKLLLKYGDRIPQFRSIVWINPTKNPGDVLDWIESGAKLDKVHGLILSPTQR